MAIVTQLKRKAETYLVPAGAEILWYGLAADVPTDFVIDSFMANVFVKGAALGSASNTPIGSDSHTHANPASTSVQANHTHPVGAPNVGGASGSTTTYGAPNTDYANAGHSHGGGATTSGLGGGHNHSLAATAAANLFPPYKRLYLIKATADVEFPVGGILMFDGPLANRPLKTELCNGSNGTLDLRSYFVYGSSADGDLGAGGGAATHTHSNPNTGPAGAHSHSISPSISANSSQTHMASTYAGTSVAAGDHNHGWDTATDDDADHTHTVGATDAASNIPPYLMLYFVMRTV